ncbi:SRPBCC family protein [Nocardiopsis sediminis]|uniref:SRPBCC family protein n=1 Tax=Nocardiopsis sediminis TaxID=1778267 RepID=A0ABV8FEA9_9ACTN
MLGTLRTLDDGRIELRFERRLGHPPAKVWRAITEPGELRHWFAQILDYDRFRFDLRAGAEIAFTPAPEFADLGTGRGTITRVDPPRLLEYTWDTETLLWELEPQGEAACLLVFTTTFRDRGSAAALGAGWHTGLDLLTRRLDGAAPGPEGAAVPDELQAAYERGFG